MGKTDAATRRRLNATIRQAGLSIGVHLCRFCEADPPEHGRCEEATEDPFVCHCDCNELDNGYGFAAGPGEVVVPVTMTLRRERQGWLVRDDEDDDEAVPLRWSVEEAPDYLAIDWLGVGEAYTHSLRPTAVPPTFIVEQLD